MGLPTRVGRQSPNWIVSVFPTDNFAGKGETEAAELMVSDFTDEKNGYLARRVYSPVYTSSLNRFQSGFKSV